MSRPNRRNHQSRAMQWPCVALIFALALGMISIQKGSHFQMIQQDSSFWGGDLSGMTRTLSYFEDAPQTKTTQRRNDPGKYKPFSCTKLLEEMRNNNETLLNLDPNNKLLYARQSDFAPSFWISLHQKVVDQVRWVIYDTGRYYEKALSAAFEEVLAASPPNTRVL